MWHGRNVFPCSVGANLSTLRKRLSHPRGKKALLTDREGQRIVGIFSMLSSPFNFVEFFSANSLCQHGRACSWIVKRFRACVCGHVLRVFCVLLRQYSCGYSCSACGMAVSFTTRRDGWLQARPKVCFTDSPHTCCTGACQGVLVRRLCSSNREVHRKLTAPL